MNDLLHAVRDGSSAPHYSAPIRPGTPTAGQDPNPFYGGGDVEMGQQPTLNHELGGFFKRVEDIKGDMVQIKALQQEVSALHERGKTIIKTKEIQKQQAEMQDKINHVNTLAHRVKSKLEALDVDNEQARSRPNQGPGSVNERTRTSMTGSLRKRLKDLMGEFSELRVQIQDEYRAVVKQRVFTVTGQHLDDENVDTIIEKGEADMIFQKAIQEQGRGRVLDTLAEVQEQQRGMQDLERSLLELHQIFLGMAALVDSQGEMLDNIEKQVERAVDHVQTGTVMLQEAREHQRKSRWWMWLCIIILAIVVIVVVLAVVLSIKPWK